MTSGVMSLLGLGLVGTGRLIRMTLAVRISAATTLPGLSLAGTGRLIRMTSGVRTSAAMSRREMSHGTSRSANRRLGLSRGLSRNHGRNPALITFCGVTRGATWRRVPISGPVLDPGLTPGLPWGGALTTAGVLVGGLSPIPGLALIAFCGVTRGVTWRRVPISGLE